MIICILFMIGSGVLFALDVAFWHTHYITTVCAVIFSVAEFVSLNLDQYRCDKMREMERRISELEKQNRSL